MHSGGKGVAEAEHVAEGAGSAAAESPVQRPQVAAKRIDKRVAEGPDLFLERRHCGPRHAQVPHGADCELCGALHCQALQHLVQCIVQALAARLEALRRTRSTFLEPRRQHVLLLLLSDGLDKKTEVGLRVATCELGHRPGTDGPLRPLGQEFQGRLAPRLAREERPDVPHRRRCQGAMVIAAASQGVEHREHTRCCDPEEGGRLPVLILILRAAHVLDVRAQCHTAALALPPENAAPLNIPQHHVKP
mmetsp:Transcript_104193/g.222677  ORF Transcript_104193/g.222677 Transcript_104193/m.222677 type:complete len:248 (+) Transcript_104193:1105-1848(+)